MAGRPAVGGSQPRLLHENRPSPWPPPGGPGPSSHRPRADGQRALRPRSSFSAPARAQGRPQPQPRAHEREAARSPRGYISRACSRGRLRCLGIQRGRPTDGKTASGRRDLQPPSRPRARTRLGGSSAAPGAAFASHYRAFQRVSPANCNVTARARVSVYVCVRACVSVCACMCV